MPMAWKEFVLSYVLYEKEIRKKGIPSVQGKDRKKFVAKLSNGQWAAKLNLDVSGYAKGKQIEAQLSQCNDIRKIWSQQGNI